MDFTQLIKTRRSIRTFKADPIPQDTLDLLLEAARWAPSAGNLQPWHFLVIKNEKLRHRLASESFGLTWLSTAPVIIVVCALPEKSAQRYGERGRTLYCLQDTAAAVQNILLAARSCGLGSCWVGAFDEAMCGEILKLPQNMRPVAMIPLGYPGQRGENANRKPIDDVITYK